METEVQKLELHKLIRDYGASIHAAIGMLVVIDPDDDNVFIYENDTR